jgi:hypothetical protein
VIDGSARAVGSCGTGAFGGYFGPGARRKVSVCAGRKGHLLGSLRGSTDHWYRFSTVAMKLETAQDLRFDNVTEEQLREAFRDDGRRGELIILSAKPEVYIQAAGEGEGPYALEYREGDDQHHYSAGDAFRKEDVLRAFQWYLAGDSRWRTEFSWQKIELKPWWKFW